MGKNTACCACSNKCATVCDSIQPEQSLDIAIVTASNLFDVSSREGRVCNASAKAMVSGLTTSGKAEWLKHKNIGYTVLKRSTTIASGGAFSANECYKQTSRWIVTNKPKLVMLMGGACIEHLLYVKNMAVADDATVGTVFVATFDYEGATHKCWCCIGYGQQVKASNAVKTFKQRYNRDIFSKVLPKAGFGDTFPPLPIYETIESIRNGVERVHDADELESILESFSPRVSLDIETSSLSPYASTDNMPRLLSCAVTDMHSQRTVAFCVDHPRGTIDKRKVKALLKHYLKTWTFVVGHNFTFDMEWLSLYLDGDPFNKSIPAAQCTMLAAMLEQGGNKGLSMAWLVQKYFGYNPKLCSGIDVTDAINADIDDLLTYNGSDTILTAMLWDKISPRLNSKQRKLYDRMAAAQRPTVAMQIESYILDDEALNNVADKIAPVCDELLTKLKALPDVAKYLKDKPDFSISSPAQVAVMFDSIGMKLARTAAGKLSVGKASLEKNKDHPAVKLYQEFCANKKTMTSFVASYRKLRTADGKVHPQYKLNGTNTLRYSCVKPNLQQVGKRGVAKVVRTAFKAAPCPHTGKDRVLIANDFGALENLCIAIASGDSRMQAMIGADIDTHRYFAHCVMQLDPSKCDGIGNIGDTRKVKGVRQSVKTTISFPRAYGAFYKTVAASGKLSESDGERLCELYDKRYAGIVKWQDRQYPTGSYIPVRSIESEQTGFIRIGILSRNQCLTGSALVRTEHGVVPIKDIRAGVKVWCLDDDMKPALRGVTWAGKTDTNRELVEINWSAGRTKGSLKCTPDHRIRMADGTYKEAAKLRPNDIVAALSRNKSPNIAEDLLSYSGIGITGVVNNHRVLSVKPISKRADVYDITVEEYHNFFADDICVHNCLNTPIQHAGAMIVLDAIIRLYYDYGMTLCGTVHDELTLPCVNDPDIIAQCAAVQGVVMITPTLPWAQAVPMVAEAEYGENMYDMNHLADMHAGKLGLWSNGRAVQSTKLLDIAREFVKNGGNLQSEKCNDIGALLKTKE